MAMQLAIDRMNQNAIVAGRGNVVDPGDHGKICVLLIGQQLSDVQMRVALRPLLRAVAGDAPIVAPKFLRSCDGRGPKLGPGLRWQVGE